MSNKIQILSGNKILIDSTTNTPIPSQYFFSPAQVYTVNIISDISPPPPPLMDELINARTLAALITK